MADLNKAPAPVLLPPPPDTPTVPDDPGDSDSSCSSHIDPELDKLLALSELGIACWQKGDFDAGLASCTEAREGLEALQEQNLALPGEEGFDKDLLNDIVNAMGGMANCHLGKREFEAALELIVQVLAMVEAAYSKDALELCPALLNIGVTYYKLRRFEDAGQAWGRALDLSSKHAKDEGFDEENTLHLRMNLAVLFQEELGDYPKALETYQEALAGLEKRFGKTNPHTLNCYMNIGILYHTCIKSYDLATVYYERALEGFVRQFEGDDPKVLKLARSLRRCCAVSDNEARKAELDEQFPQMFHSDLKKEQQLILLAPSAADGHPACPLGHELENAATAIANDTISSMGQDIRNCDVCGEGVEHSRIFGCWDCDFDACRDCIDLAKTKTGVTPAVGNQPMKNDDASEAVMRLRTTTENNLVNLAGMIRVRRELNSIAATNMSQNKMSAASLSSFSTAKVLKQRGFTGSVEELLEEGSGVLSEFNRIMRAVVESVQLIPDAEPLVEGKPIAIDDRADNNFKCYTGAPLKSVERCNAKIIEEYDGDVSRVLDVIRASIICETEDQVAGVVAALLDLGIVARLKNRFASPLFTGIRDCLINVEVDGHICEVQVHLSHIIARKHDAHVFYEYFRDLFSGAAKSYQRRMETAMELGEIGTTKGDGEGSVTAGVVRILEGTDKFKLRALSELCEANAFNDSMLLLAARKRLSELTVSSI
jgi:tetratricopeptide (TPR) repeat protein